MLVILKNLLLFRQPIPLRKGAKSSTSGPNSRTTTNGNLTVLSGVKDAESNCISNNTSIDVEAGEAATGPLNVTQKTSVCASLASIFSLSLITSFVRQGFFGIKQFRPSPRMVSDAIIGLADGMTVPFALTAGLSTLGNTRLVQLGGIGELVAGMISMGVGGAWGAKAES